MTRADNPKRREIQRAANRKYYWKNRERLLQDPKRKEQARVRARAYYRAHKEEILAKARTVTGDERERCLSVRRKWRETNRKRVRAYKRASYRRHRVAIAAKNRTKYIKNRQAILQLHRDRYDARRRFVMPEELEACLQDPRKAKTIRGDGAIVCLECGQALRSLNIHLRVTHGLTAAQYKAKPGQHAVTRRYNAGSGLVCVELSQKFQKLSRRQKRRPLPRHPREKLRLFLGKARQYERSMEYRLNERDRNSGRSQPSSWKRLPNGELVTDAQILQLHLRGTSARQIAQKVGLGFASVGRRIRRMGLPSGHGRCFQHGEPVTGEYIAHLCTDFEKSRSEMANVLEVTEQCVASHIRGGVRQRHLPIPLAQRAIILRGVLRGHHKRSAPTLSGGRPRVLLPSEAEVIPGKYEALRRDLKLLHQWLEKQGRPVDVDRVWEWLCSQARRRVIRTLVFWPQFFEWFKRQGYSEGYLDHRRTKIGAFSTEWTPHQVAIEFLSTDYGVSAETIRNQVRRKARPPGTSSNHGIATDVRKVFNGRSAVRSADLVSGLKTLSPAQYANLTPRKLAHLLIPYAIRPRNFRLNGRIVKAYSMSDLKSVPPQATSATKARV